MRRTIFTVLLMGAQALFAAGAHANFVTLGGFGSYNGAVIEDTATTLVWLPFGPTRFAVQDGYSVNDLLGGAGGFLASGFRFANLPEVDRLFSDAGIQSFVNDSVWPSATYTAENGAGAALLLSLFGNVNLGGDTMQGIAGVDTSTNTFYLPWAGVVGSNGAAGCLIADAYCAATSDMGHHLSVGAFLVMGTSELPATDVPEPFSASLVIGGVVALAAVRRGLATAVL